MPRRPLRAALAALLCLALGLVGPGARAQATGAPAKVAPDLLAAISGGAPSPLPWLGTVGDQAMVKVLVASSSADASLAELRGFVLSVGGSVYYNYASLRMLAVMVPASRVMDLAQRADVVSVSPNRAVVRTASTLQKT